LPTKTIDFEVKNRCKTAEKANAEHLLELFYFVLFSIVIKAHFSVRDELDKVVL